MHSPPEPEVSIVIVCWNSAAYLARCLQALEAQTTVTSKSSSSTTPPPMDRRLMWHPATRPPHTG